jgi:GntR family transcriptional repressor for pyruvate dehydrogenase complex
VSWVRGKIEDTEFRPGDRLPSERELASRIGVSRASVRAGLQALATMGVVESRHGSGTYITSGPPTLASEPLGLLATLHGISREDLFEARRILEVAVAGMAAGRPADDGLVEVSEAVADMYTSLDDPQTFLLHDIRFHRALGAACANPVLAALVDMMSQLFYQQRKDTIERAPSLRQAAESHRRVYDAVRARDVEGARQAMDEHVSSALCELRAEGRKDAEEE